MAPRGPLGVLTRLFDALNAYKVDAQLVFRPVGAGGCSSRCDRQPPAESGQHRGHHYKENRKRLNVWLGARKFVPRRPKISSSSGSLSSAVIPSSQGRAGVIPTSLKRVHNLSRLQSKDMNDVLPPSFELKGARAGPRTIEFSAADATKAFSRN